MFFFFSFLLSDKGWNSPLFLTNPLPLSRAKVESCFSSYSINNSHCLSNVYPFGLNLPCLQLNVYSRDSTVILNFYIYLHFFTTVGLLKGRGTTKIPPPLPPKKIHNSKQDFLQDQQIDYSLLINKVPDFNKILIPFLNNNILFLNNNSYFDLK